jgi:[ribosomal protein S18]-alanine N-acetyltransferase
VTLRALTVRPARRSDLDAVLAIEEASFSTPWGRGTFEALLGRPTVLFRVLVGLEEGDGSAEAGVEGRVAQNPEGARDPEGASTPAAVVGHGILWWVGPEAEVANVAVHPALRGSGAGGILLDTLLAEAGIQGVERVFLEVRESNAPARALYARRGFAEVGRRKRYYRKPTEDALILALDLGAPVPASEPPSEPPHGAAVR